LENGIRVASPSNKKRKFSPIVWDRDYKEVRKTFNSGAVVETAILSSEYPLDEGISKSKSVSVTNIQASVSEDNEVHSSEVSPSKTDPLLCLSQWREEASSQRHQSESSVENQGSDSVYDDEDRPVRTIISSRWASDADSPADEGEILDYEDQQKLKSKCISVFSGLGEAKAEVSARTKENVIGSDEHVRSSDRDSCQYVDFKTECVKFDDRHEQITGFRSDSENFDDLGSVCTPESFLIFQRSVNMLHGCRSVDEFERLNKINEGTYGVVYRAKDKKTGEIVALKKVKMEKEREGFPLTSLREINILLSFNQPCIVDVKEVVVGSNLDSIFMVMEYMEHDLKGLMESMEQPFSQSEVKCLMLQLLEGIKYLHDNWVLHRDLKTSNLLLNNSGELKICDFGLARQYGSPLKPYTHMVVTLWYRAPELLLGGKQYSTAIDMWSLGCIMAELLSKEPLFNGKTEVDQLEKAIISCNPFIKFCLFHITIFKILGTPTQDILPGLSELPGAKVNFVKLKYNMLRKKFPATSFTGSPFLSDAGFDLLNKLLTYDPEKRIAAEAALKHEWFREAPLPKSKEFMPTFPSQHAPRQVKFRRTPPDPLQEQRMRELRQGDMDAGGLFG
ncbi:hypothetical protein M569_05173, partial [Genlisea aurea]